MSTPEPSTAPHPVLAGYYGAEPARQPFLDGLFDRGAPHYDRICRWMSLGTGSTYRRRALQLAGLRRGHRFLDVASGTGLMLQAAQRLGLAAADAVGLDPSRGMLRQSRAVQPSPLVRAVGTELPFADGSFDFAAFGYGLRHLADLGQGFRELRRVLRPGGRLLILELVRPRGRLLGPPARLWLSHVVPRLAGLLRGADAERMMRYYWETIAACVPPDVVLAELRAAGFTAAFTVRGALLGEYLAIRP